MEPETVTCDALILGSGSAGLAAALAAGVAGLTTIVAEKTSFLGGTSAISGAGTWIPGNRHARAAGIDDSAEDALRYIEAASPPDWDRTEAPLWSRFAAMAPETLDFLEANSPLRFMLVEGGDPFPDLPGARPYGRMLTPRPLAPAILGRAWAARIRPAMAAGLFTYPEIVDPELQHHPVRTSVRLLPRLAMRWLRGKRGRGTALIVGLLRGCLDRGVRLMPDCPARSLIRDEVTGDICGAILQSPNGPMRVIARRGVVIATGGFEWDRERLAHHFPGPIDWIASPNGNAGDGHRMAEEAGGALAHMDQANINPAVPIRYDGRLQGMALFFHRAPNAIIVNRHGRRFFNETMFNFGEKIDERDQTGSPVHLPAWLIGDQAFLRASPILRRHRRYDPNWMVEAPDIVTLAERIGLPPAELKATVARFNGFCQTGIDTDFGRRTRSSTTSSHPDPIGLLPIGEAPFIAVPFNRSFASTKGGPRTDARGRVLRPDGSVINGLYCAGVAMANPFGTRGIGAGTTIGPNLVWGYVCGRDIAGLLEPDSDATADRMVPPPVQNIHGLNGRRP